MNNYKKQENETFLLKMSKITKTWIWQDEGELYVFENNKIKPATKNGYNKICQIVRKEFINQYIEKVN
jgi:hypothetical protein